MGLYILTHKGETFPVINIGITVLPFGTYQHVTWEEPTASGTTVQYSDEIKNTQGFMVEENGELVKADAATVKTFIDNPNVLQRIRL